MSNYRVCPLLKHPQTYTPDIQDLLSNEPARIYWLTTLERTVAKFVDKANALNPDNPKAEEHAKICLEKFQNLIVAIKQDPRTLIPLSVRTLLEYNEENLRVYFSDAWYSQKQTETEQALNYLQTRLKQVDSIDNFNDKWLELIKGVLAGNVFDWGSATVSTILDNSPNFNFDKAMDIIEKRPWFIDDVDVWIKRLNTRTFKLAVIFVDNAGADFILGILPFVRQLLLMGTKVILTANSHPSLNDITHKELTMYCDLAARHCQILTTALAHRQLITVENGQKGPCLDLNKLPIELCDLMQQSDLIVLEGMGRSVHTNLHTEFQVDSVKMAVLKNEWLANSLGANQFGAIFKYEVASM